MRNSSRFVHRARATHSKFAFNLFQGKGAPQLWLVGASSQIVCLSSGELTSIMLRAEGGGQKPDVTSFFDGFISLLPVASSPLNSGLRQHDTKGVNVRNSSAADLNTLQQHSATAARSLSSASAAAAGQPSSYEPDIKQLKHVLDSINTTKTMAKIALTQQVDVPDHLCHLTNVFAGAHLAQGFRVLR